MPQHWSFAAKIQLRRRPKKGPAYRGPFSKRVVLFVLLSAALLAGAAALIVLVLILLAALALLLPGLLARLRLVLTLLRIILARLVVLIVLVVRHSLKSFSVGDPQQSENPLRGTIVPQKSHSSQGFFINVRTVAQSVGLPNFAAATSMGG
jgi:hypothetical protein